MVLKDYCKSLFVMLLVAVFGISTSGQAQDRPETGGEFIYFVDGVNVLVPSTPTQTVNDPLDPTSGNLVSKFNFGSWAEVGYDWPSGGVDMSANFPDTAGQGDKLFFKILVDPANAGQTSLKLAFFDKVSGTIPSREEAEAADTIPDYQFRLNWEIPETMRNGEWHEVELALPPRTIAALDSAKVDKYPDGTPIPEDMRLDEMSKMWTYGGAWGAGYGVACCGSAYDNDPSSDPLWTEFEYDAVRGLNIHFDFETGGGPVYLDDVYVGDEDTDLSVAVNPPSALDNIALSTDGAVNVVSWVGAQEFGGYNVYVSEDPITDVDAANVLLLKPVAFSEGEGDNFSVRHDFKAPHPSLAASATTYYAVTSKSQFGVENKDASASTDGLTNDLESLPFIQMLTDDQADILFENADNGIVSPEGFPEGLAPFEIEFCSDPGGQVPGPCPSGEQVGLSETLTFPTSPEDNTGKFWIGISNDAELFMYAEVSDDVFTPTPASKTGGEAWEHDSIELAFGTYSVESFLLGSDHLDMERGEFPDHQVRFGARDEGETEYATFAWESNSINGDIEGASTAWDSLTAGGKGGSQAMTGWKLLVYVPLSQIIGAGSGDSVFEPPAETEVKLIPFTIAINDDDGSAREHQINWSTKPNLNNSWWNTPAQWLIAAVAGQSVATSTEDVGELPLEFALEQNYPNPFNPSTAIRFSVPTTEKVTLNVYNVLGHRVATLIDGETMNAGQHSVAFDAGQLASGMYIYRLEAGAEFVQTRRMLLVK